MPIRISKSTRQLQRMDRYANLYAKQFAPDAAGVVIHMYPKRHGYEIEVLAADGSTLTVLTVGHAQLVSTADRMRKKLQDNGQP